MSLASLHCTGSPPVGTCWNAAPAGRCGDLQRPYRALSQRHNIILQNILGLLIALYVSQRPAQPAYQAGTDAMRSLQRKVSSKVKAGTQTKSSNLSHSSGGVKKRRSKGSGTTASLNNKQDKHKRALQPLPVCSLCSQTQDWLTAAPQH